MTRYASDLAPQELLEEAAKILAKDKARISGLNYPVYKGPTIAPMSSLTQRARTLKEEFAQKGAPYAKKLEKILSRSNEGVSPARMAQQLAMLKQGQEGFHANTVLGALKNQFRSSYEPRVPQFVDQGQRNIDRGQNKFTTEFGDLGKASGTLEQSSNQQLVNSLQQLQAQKEARRKTLTGTLEQFGAQKHGHTNLVNEAQRNLFNEEAAAPYKRMEMLREGLGPLTGNMGDETLPDIKTQSGKEALNALRAYGVDVSKPVEEWDSARTSPSTYKGKLVADLTPEISTSHNVLERVNPKFRDSLYDKRKALVGQLLGDESVAGRALAGVPERMRGPISALEEEARRKLQNDMGSINAQFIRRNMYGSSAHLKASEKRAQEIAEATFEERNKLLQDAMKTGLSLEHQQQIGNLKQLGQYGEHGQKEFGDTLSKVIDMNKLGSTKWGNEQAENEELYKNYQNEAAWEWPHMRNRVRDKTIGDVFSNISGKKLGLDELAQLKTMYSELNKGPMSTGALLSTSKEVSDALYPSVEDLERAYTDAKKRYADVSERAQWRNEKFGSPEYFAAIAARDEAYDQDWLAKKAFEIARMKRNGTKGLDQYSSEAERQKAQQWNEDQVAKMEQWFDANLATTRSARQRSIDETYAAIGANEQWKRDVARAVEAQNAQRAAATQPQVPNYAQNPLQHPEVVKRNRLLAVVGAQQWGAPQATDWLRRNSFIK